MRFLHTGEAPGVCFRHRDPRGEYRWVIVARITYAIADDGTLARVAPQPPLQIAEEGFGDVLETPIRYESDLAPHKPYADVVIHAHAHAPNGRAAERFDVALAVREADLPSGAPGKLLLSRTLTVTGPRRWRHRGALGRAAAAAGNLATLGLAGASDWTLTDPEPTLEVPLRFDLAFGGTVEVDAPDHPKQRLALAHGENPVGRGFLPDPRQLAEDYGIELRAAEKLCERWVEAHQEIPAPQIEIAGEPLTSTATYPLAGWGYVAKHWELRYRHAGTYDDAWQAKRHPLLPEDFDPRYWNGAHPDLQLDELPEDAVIELLNVVPSARSPRQALRIRLPGTRIEALVVHGGREAPAARMKLDTVIVDVVAGRVVTVYRHSVVDDGRVSTVAIDVDGSRFRPREIT